MNDLFFDSEFISRLAPARIAKGEKLTKKQCDEGFKIISVRIPIEMSYSRIKSCHLLSRTLQSNELVNIQAYTSYAIYITNEYRSSLSK